MILADTVIWIKHLRESNQRLASLLSRSEVVMHPKVLGELACGSLAHRTLRLRQWRNMPQLDSVSDDTAMEFIERHSLMSRGLGFIDVHLLAACAAQLGTRLWTRDRRLANAARTFDLGFPRDHA